MRVLRIIAGVLFGLTVSPSAQGQACVGGEDATCVSKDDLRTFLWLARDAKCRTETVPTFKLDPVTIVTDKQGRVFASGTGPKPYKIKVDWCNYSLEATGAVTLIAAEKEEPTWGFRFRPKIVAGLLPLEALHEKSLPSGLDGGVLVEPFFISWFNVNAFVGVRSVGAGIGMDVSRNIGVYAGYAVTWGTWRSSPYIGVDLSLF